MAIEHQPPALFIPGRLEPVYFLAGPIQGAPDWQAAGSERIKLFRPGRHAHIANPRRNAFDDTFRYDDQVNWEKHYILRASDYGGVIFWFAARDYSLPYREGRQYAKTSLKELERVAGMRLKDPGVQVTLGIDPGYLEDEQTDKDYLNNTVNELSLHVFDTLEATIDHALARSM